MNRSFIRVDRLKETGLGAKGKSRFTAEQVQRGELLGRGSFGEIRQFELVKGGKRRLMAVKEHYPFVDREKIKSMARMNSMLRKAGVKVFTTYRPANRGTDIIMTLATNSETVCLGGNKTLESFNLPPMIKIENIDNLAKDLVSNSYLSAKAGVLLGEDCFLFIVDRGTRTKLDFVVGDLDLVVEDDSQIWAHEDRASRLLKNFKSNLKDAKTGLSGFFLNKSNVQPDSEAWKSIREIAKGLADLQKSENLRRFVDSAEEQKKSRALPSGI